MTAPLPLQLDKVTCVLGAAARQVTALDTVSLELHPGELVAVMGPSDSGKSTLLNVAGLLQRPTSGRVLIDGRDASGFSRAAAAEQALAEVGLDGLGGRFPEEISGGQAQRAAIARALVGERRLLLADEPTGALDTTTGDEVLQLLRSRVDAGAAALLVTHEPRFAGWADRVVFVRDGRLTAEEGVPR